MPGGVQTSTTDISLRGQRAGLVGADERGRAERLDRLEPADQRVAVPPSAARPWPATSVTVGSSPQGTTATVTPTANRKPSRRGRAQEQAQTPKNTDADRDRNAGEDAYDPVEARLRAGFVGRALPAGQLRDPRQARSGSPLRRRSRSPSPSTTNEPACSTSPGVGPRGRALTCELRRVDRAARAARVERAGRPRSGRPRPGARGPRRTSSSASIVDRACRRAPPWRGRGSRSRSRSAARSARCSWANANTPFSDRRPRRWRHRAGAARPTNASAPATQNMSAKKWTICAASRRHAGAPAGTGSRLRARRPRAGPPLPQTRGRRSVDVGLDGGRPFRGAPLLRPCPASPGPSRRRNGPRDRGDGTFGPEPARPGPARSRYRRAIAGGEHPSRGEPHAGRRRDRRQRASAPR